MPQEFARRGLCTSKYTGIRVTAPGANTGITGGITFGPHAAACRVTVGLATSSVFNVTVDDGTEVTYGLNGSTALAINDLATFTFGVRGTHDGTALVADGGSGIALSYDFEVETDGVINYLLIEEVQGPVV